MKISRVKVAVLCVIYSHLEVFENTAEVVERSQPRECNNPIPNLSSTNPYSVFMRVLWKRASLVSTGLSRTPHFVQAILLLKVLHLMLHQ